MRLTPNLSREETIKLINSENSKNRSLFPALAGAAMFRDRTPADQLDEIDKNAKC